MTDMVTDIRDFHEKFDLEFGSITGHIRDFRIRFMHEELGEYLKAASEKNAHDMLDALVDLTYVVLGTAYLEGYDFEEAWKRVHAANMEKDRP